MRLLVGLLIIYSSAQNVLGHKCPDQQLIMPCSCREEGLGYSLKCDSIHNPTVLKPVFQNIDMHAIHQLHLLNVDYHIPQNVTGGKYPLPLNASVYITCKNSSQDLVVDQKAFTDQTLHQISVTNCTFETGNLDFTQYFRRIILDRVRTTELFRQKQDYQAEHLTLSGANLTEKSEESLEQLGRLRELHIDNCSFGEFRTAYHVHPVQKLSFSQINFEQKSFRFLEKFIALKSLSFNDCALPAKTDLIESNIEEITFSKQELADIDLRLFLQPFLNLLSLTMKNCQTLNMDTFPSIPKLESISLLQTKFSKWFDTSLTPNMVSLAISDYPDGPDALLNILDSVKNYQLRRLSLENNNLERVPAHIALFQDLEYLSLAGNGIVLVRNESLMVSFPLQTIDLSNNPLLFVESGAFQGDLKNLKILLHGTRMETLNERAFAELLKHVDEIRFSREVPFLCGCDVAWLFRGDRSLLNKVNDAFCHSSSGKQSLQDLNSGNFTHCTSEPLHPWSQIRKCDRSNCSGHGDCYQYPTSLVAFSWNSQFDSYCRCDDGYHGRCCEYTGSYEQIHTRVSNEPVVELSTEDVNYVIEVEYAHLRFCPLTEGNACSDVRLRELPNTMALVSYWCNGTTDCRIDPVTIQSYSNVRERNSGLDVLASQRLMLEIRWRKRRIDTLRCPAGAEPGDDGDCYQVDCEPARWFTARERALSSGADLAFITSQQLNLPNVSGAWVLQMPHKNQRLPQPYYTAFENGQARYNSSGSQYSITSCGLRVLPLQLNKTDVDDGQSLVTRMQFTGDQWNTTTVSSFNGCERRCFPNHEADYCFLGYPGLNKKLCPKQTGSKYAKWECTKENDEWAWVSASPDFSECSRIDQLLENATDQLGVTAVPEVINGLHSNLTDTGAPLIAGDIVKLGDFFSIALDVHNKNLTAEQDPGKRYEMAQNFTDAVLGLANLILEEEQGWWGIPEKNRAAQLAKYETTFEATVLQLTENKPTTSDKTEVFASNKLVFQTERVLLEATEDESVHDISVNGSNVATINLKPYEESNITEVNLMLVYVKNAPEVLSGDETIRWQDVIQQRKLNVSIIKVNSPSLSLSVKEAIPNRTVSVTYNLAKDFIPAPFDTTFRRVVTYQEYIENSTCVHWDSDIDSWSSSGCALVNVTADQYSCACKSIARVVNRVYLKNYATDELPLKVITMVGGIVSSAALALSVFVFVWIRTSSARDPHNNDLHITIHANLCFNLLWAQIVYLAGLENVQPSPRDPSCLTIAFLLHLFYLTTFAWMVVEAVYIYYKIYKPYENTKVTIYRCLAFGYGVPTCIVSASFFSTFSSGQYTDTEACFVGNVYALIGGFVVPVALGITYNTVILVAVLFVALRNKFHKKETIRKNEKPPKKSEVLRVLLSGILLSFLLGTTWIFILLYVLQTTIGWAYTFTIVNATQGLFIVYYTCFSNETVREGLRRKLRQHNVRAVRTRMPMRLTSRRTGTTSATDVSLSSTATQ